MLYRALERTASRIPEHLAILHGEEAVTFGRLNAMALGIQSFFRQAGLQKGDRVLVLLDNGAEYAAVFFGILHAGGVVVPLNPTNTPDNVRYVAEHCTARFSVANVRSYPLLATWWKGPSVLIDGSPPPHTVSLSEIMQNATPSPVGGDRPGTEDLAIILYTSGTTGNPKGVMLSHRNLEANTKSILEYLPLTPADRTLAILPFYYSYGNSLLLTHVSAGATLVVENGFAYLANTLNMMKKHRITGFSGVPSHFAMLLGRSRFLEEDWPHLRYMTCAGGPLPVAHIRKIREILPRVQLHVMYGQTEGAARLSSLDPSLVDRKIGSIGRGIPGVELRVTRENGRDVVPGEVGEIVARGKNLMMGYLGDPGSTSEVIRKGWLHTGDLATVDPEGFIYIRGRKQEFIKSGGYRIGPQQIEDVIHQHPSVQECAVVGAPDDLLGERIIAFVVFRPGNDPEAAKEPLLNFLRGRMPAYMVPAQLVPIEALQKTESGKIKRVKLKELASRSGDRSTGEYTPRPACSATLLHHFLADSARKYPDKVALVAGGGWTYGQLDRASDALAGSLLEKGFEKGDRFGICCGNAPETIVGIFGALKAGGAFVLVNPAAKKSKLEYILSNAGCTALLSPAGRLEPSPLEFLRNVPSVRQTYLTDLAETSSPLYSYSRTIRRQDPFRPPTVIDVDLAALIYTSGSTGFPKGVVMTHQNMVAAARSITAYLGNREDDVVLNLLPLSFDYGLYQVLNMFLVGGRVVFEDPFVYPQDIVRAIREHGVTGLPCVPTIFALLSHLGDSQCHTLDTLRYVTNTGSALNEKYIRKIRELFPSVRLYSMYGLTECKRVSYMPPEEIDRRPGSVGKAMPNVETYIVKEDGNIAEPGEPGELVVRGSNVMQGYWKDPEATSRVLKQGKSPWEKVLYTGDLFKSDEEGFLYFLGRKDDVIKTRGEKVSPREIENVILGLAEVREAVVVGVPDDVLGQAIHAHVVLVEKGALSADAIRDHCERDLERSIVPRRVFIHDAIPRNSSGKVDKSLLPGR